MKKTIILLIATILVLSVLTSCKKSSEVNNNNNDGPAVEGVRVGNIAITFTETDTNGDTFSLDSLKGKVILLNFSAMWCGPCRQEASQLNEIYNTYKERGLEIIQCIYQDEDGNPSTIDDINRWLKEFGISFTVFNDPDRSTVNTYNFNSIPYNIIIDRDFIIRYVMSGFDHDAVIQKITQYL